MPCCAAIMSFSETFSYTIYLTSTEGKSYTFFKLLSYLFSFAFILYLQIWWENIYTQYFQSFHSCLSLSQEDQVKHFCLQAHSEKSTYEPSPPPILPLINLENKLSFLLLGVGMQFMIHYCSHFAFLVCY